MTEKVDKNIVENFLKDNFPQFKITNDPFEHFLHYNEGEIIGIVSYSLIYERAEINYICVKKDFQNKKIGTKLLNEVLNVIDKKGIKCVSLEVNENNINAIKLYKKFDFKIVSKRKNYYNGEDGFLMVRKLGDKMDTYILAIESSCDETSTSIIKNGCEEVATTILSQMDIHANFGGVVPEIASRNHVKNITMVLEETLKKANMNIEDISAIAVTYGPGLIGSLLVGVMSAKMLAYTYDKPLVPVHHIAGHIYANNLVKPLEFPLIALVISGGHTELIYMKENYSFEKLGGTLDDAVGEAYDKVARVLGLDYPGGPLVDKLAHIGKDTYDLPLPLNDNSYDFSFSGLKSAVINKIHNEKQKGNEINIEDMATSFQNRVIEILVKKTMKALKEKNVKNLIVAGGVAANKGLRERLLKECEGINLTLPEIKYCTDNAAMIGSAGYFAYKKGRRADLELNAKANDVLN